MIVTQVWSGVWLRYLVGVAHVYVGCGLGLRWVWLRHKVGVVQAWVGVAQVYSRVSVAQA